MKRTAAVLSVLLPLLWVGCSSSRPTSTASERDTTTTTRAPSSAPSEEDSTVSAPTQAPRDWHHLERVPRSGPGIDIRTAYRTLLEDRSPKDTVRVAIIDSGVDIHHEDLTPNIWSNSDEVPGNNIDDDNNGYVDDVHGWNFIGGPNGENVNQDTYELTRIYVTLRKRFSGVDSADVPREQLDPYRRYQTIKREFKRKRQEAEKRLQKVRQLERSIEGAEQTLKAHLQTDTLTQNAVSSISSPKRKVQRARNFLLRYYKQDLSPSDIREYRDYLERQVQYNYNPDFNPRPIVGDDYSNKTERRYGNNDVVGPDAAHGTHVAGIIGAVRNNGIGIDGISHGIRLMSVRTVPKGDERDKDVANAIRYAVENGADVINMSFGKKYSPHKSVVDAAVQYADSQGVLMVHAAGNDGVNVDSVQNYPSPYYQDGGRAQLWIEVGASSWKGGKHLAAPFSNYGSERVAVFAPGQSIYSTAPNDQYTRNGGTSMAAPMVTGLAAVMMAYYPSLPAADIRSILLNTATDYSEQIVSRPGASGMVRFGTLSRTGAIINAQAALRRAEESVTSR